MVRVPTKHESKRACEDRNHYNSPNHSLMNAVLRNATNLENKQELTERLLKPLGIEKSYIDEPSLIGTIGDIGLRPHDMLKFGLMYLHEGKWNEKQVVPPDPSC